MFNFNALGAAMEEDDDEEEEDEALPDAGSALGAGAGGAGSSEGGTTRHHFHCNFISVANTQVVPAPFELGDTFKHEILSLNKLYQRW